MRLNLALILFAGLLSATNLWAQQKAPTGTLRVILPEVQFSKEKTSIQPTGLQDLNEVATLLKASPTVRAEIQVHTDASGSTSYNLRLSQKRAAVVRDYLIKKGVPAKRLTAKGFGEAKPLNRCGRGANCSDAEKRENRRVELLVKGLPADSAVQAPWLILAGIDTPTPHAAPTVPKMTPDNSARTRRLPEANNSVPLPKPEQQQNPASDDYSPEHNEGKSYTPKSLPKTFIGYTIEITCSPKPQAAGAALFRKYETVYLRDEPDGGYCYFIGAFFTLPEAHQFLRETVLPDFAKARVVAFSGDTKTYLNK